MSAPSKAKAKNTKEGSRKGDAEHTERKRLQYEKSNELDGTAGGPREVDDRHTAKVTGEKTEKG